MSHYVLITGYRQQLAKALYQLNIPYSVITDKTIKFQPRGVDEVLISDLSKIKSAQDVQALQLKHQPTHVIAGTEAGVFPAAVLRRFFEARRSTKTLLNRCTDKTEMKKFLSERGILMTGFVNHKKGLTAETVVDELGLPVVVKDRKNSGGRNVVVAKSLDELRPLLAPQRLYEQFIDAKEGSIESFVHKGEVIFSSITEYHTNKIANIIPASYSDEEKKHIRHLNEKVIKALNIKWGLTHLEYYRGSGGELFGEVALRPPGGYIMELIQCAYGFNPWEVFVQVELGIEIEQMPAQADQVCGTVLLHPGEGKVLSVDEPTTSQYPSLSKASIKVKAGDHIQPRQGVGEDVGHCVFSADNHVDVIKDIEKMIHSEPVKI